MEKTLAKNVIGKCVLAIVDKRVNQSPITYLDIKLCPKMCAHGSHSFDTPDHLYQEF